MRNFACLIVTIATAALAACAIPPRTEIRPGAMCSFTRYDLQVPIPGEDRKREASSVAAQDGRALLRAEIGQALARAPESAASEAGAMLFMSGGSQNGAFGAGFLRGWAEARAREENAAQPGGSGGATPNLPQFRVVTGISTGSIAATFAFLGDFETPATQYQIARETDVMLPYVGSGSLGLGSAVKVARRGAVGELMPLRLRLRELMHRERLGQVADAYAQGRRLYVAATDVDTGLAVVFDMGEMAQRAVGENNDEGFAHFRDCYVEAILASSSVPLAALPTFIDNRMYIDGGARFGIFSDEIGAIIEPSVKESPRRSPAIYAIVNGDLMIEEQCRKKDPALCQTPAEARGLSGEREQWRLTDLGFRSVGILIDQGYRFSTNALLQRAERIGYPFHLARIQAGLEDFEYTLDDPQFGSGRRTCPEWLSEDKRLDAPLEFHARYMRCLVAYGYERGLQQDWENKAGRADAPVQ